MSCMLVIWQLVVSLFVASKMPLVVNASIYAIINPI